jgi:NAD(P)-dependent dehydrogenase (short-subunit alcohol dehydrogenase family)
MAVLIVGAGPGMGASIASALAPAHGPVALLGLDQDAMARVADDLQQAGADARAFRTDASREESLRAAIAAARAAVGPPTVVVFNLSVFVPGPPTTMDLPAFRSGLEAGITAAVVTVQATAADLLAGAPSTSLLFTGSEAALRPWAGGIGLAVQKAGMRHIALACAEEFAGTGVHVATVTIHGTLARSGPFQPSLIAPVYAALATPGPGRPVEVNYRAEGPDWVPAGH